MYILSVEPVDVVDVDESNQLKTRRDNATEKKENESSDLSVKNMNVTINHGTILFNFSRVLINFMLNCSALRLLNDILKSYFMLSRNYGGR